MDNLAEQKAIEIHKKAEKNALVITQDLKKFEEDNFYLQSKDKKIKTLESIKRKILLNASDNGVISEASINAASDDIKDYLRYTFIAENNSEYVSKTDNVLTKLKEKGYDIELSNYWNDPKSDTYNGINVKLSKDINGEKSVIELQFHTPESYAAKGELTHASYEVRRNKYMPDHVKNIANDMQVEIEKNISIPDGVMEYTFNNN